MTSTDKPGTTFIALDNGDAAAQVLEKIYRRYGSDDADRFGMREEVQTPSISQVTLRRKAGQLAWGHLFDRPEPVVLLWLEPQRADDLEAILAMVGAEAYHRVAIVAGCWTYSRCKAWGQVSGENFRPAWTKGCTSYYVSKAPKGSLLSVANNIAALECNPATPAMKPKRRNTATSQWPSSRQVGLFPHTSQMCCGPTNWMLPG